MRRALSYFVFLAIFLAGIIAGIMAGIISSPPGDNIIRTETLQKVPPEILELERKQEQHPFDADLQFILGSNYWTLNNNNKAIKHYKRALTLDPEYSAAHWNLSVIYNQNGDGANAISHMKKAEAIYLKMEDLRSLARAREKLRGFFSKYNYKPEDFELRQGFLWQIFN